MLAFKMIVDGLRQNMRINLKSYNNSIQMKITTDCFAKNTKEGLNMNARLLIRILNLLKCKLRKSRMSTTTDYFSSEHEYTAYIIF